jgi:hypothetical protein
MDTESPPKIVDLMAAHLGAADGRARRHAPSAASLTAGWSKIQPTFDEET